MKTFLYDPRQTPSEIVAALEAIAEDFPVRPAASGKANVTLTLDVEAEGPSFTVDAGRAAVRGATLPQVLRALAQLRGHAHEGTPPAAWSESARFDMLGLMQDMSRFAVMRASTVEYLLRRIALMGMNVLMLYTEDTYEIPGEPWFGYMRGRYTQDEMKQIDAYAATVGVEVIPCIQTLGHLGQALKWPAYENVRDKPDILLVDEPRTYELIERMLESTTACFRSRRIHVGMDEAHGVGQGRYRELFGERSGFEVMNRHLARVVEMCGQRGLRPMMWSDMYFRLGSASNDYYDRSCVIPDDVASGIPREMELVYWDYYHADRAFYEEWLDRHRALGSEPIFAGGAWMWGMMWPNYDRSRRYTAAAMAACRDRGVRQAFTTAWGDDGHEADALANLPNLQFFADTGYMDDVTDAAWRRGFRGSCGATLDAWLLAGRLDKPPGMATMREIDQMEGRPTPDSAAHYADADENVEVCTASKYLLWQDPMLGLFDAHLEGLPLEKHYRKLTADLEKAMKAGGEDRRRLTHARNLASVLELKAELGVKLAAAWTSGGATRKRRLTPLRDQTLPELAKRVRRLHRGHRTLWLAQNKAQGFEVLEGRYAQLGARVDFARQRLDDFLSGRVDHLEELDEPRRRWVHWPEGKLSWAGSYRRIYSPTMA